MKNCVVRPSITKITFVSQARPYCKWSEQEVIDWFIPRAWNTNTFSQIYQLWKAGRHRNFDVRVLMWMLNPWPIKTLRLEITYNYVQCRLIKETSYCWIFCLLYTRRFIDRFSMLRWHMDTSESILWWSARLRGEKLGRWTRRMWWDFNDTELLLNQHV